MSKSEQLLHDLFKVLLRPQSLTWWDDTREKAGIDPFEPDRSDHLLLLMDYYLKCQSKMFERITLYCEQEIQKNVTATH